MYIVTLKPVLPGVLMGNILSKAFVINHMDIE
jgi:hypothetical protein